MHKREWRPVGTGLPNKNQSVVITRHFQSLDGKNHWSVDEAYFKDGQFYRFKPVRDTAPLGGTVTAWMPRIRPYKKLPPNNGEKRI